MTAATRATEPGRGPAATARALFRDYPLIPLIGLLILLILLIRILQPETVSLEWFGVILRASIPLALLAACQTITFLTGGIDLSVGAVASMSGFLVATLVGNVGLVPAILIALAVAALAGFFSGIGVGVFRVHPLIMTLGMSLVVLGLANVWQILMVQTGAGVPGELRWIGSSTTAVILPNSLLVFVPVSAFLLVMLRRTGFGRLLYAIGDNPVASRLSGARSWQVLCAPPGPAFRWSWPQSLTRLGRRRRRR